MALPTSHPMTTVKRTPPLEELFDAWVYAALDATAALHAWAAMSPRDRATAHAVYRAALDREESAADSLMHTTPQEPQVNVVTPLRPAQHNTTADREVTDYEMVRGTHDALELISSKWSVEVLYLLASGTRRYCEIYYDVGEISKKTLTQTLRVLANKGLVVRRAYAEVPPRVEYSLTPLGWSITELLMSLYEWSAAHLEPEVPEPVPQRLAS
jgi:DNA-binding HxlR family transcriptional regulator